MENNKNKKSVKFQGDMLNFCDFIQVFVFTTNHHLKVTVTGRLYKHKTLLGFLIEKKYWDIIRVFSIFILKTVMKENAHIPCLTFVYNHYSGFTLCSVIFHPIFLSFHRVAQIFSC